MKIQLKEFDVLSLILVACTQQKPKTLDQYGEIKIMCP